MKKKIGLSSSKLLWQTATLIALIILFASPINTALVQFGMRHEVAIPSAVSIVSAQEVYEMFTCPCCSQPLRKEDPCCGAMTQMTDFIDQKTNTKSSKDEIVLATAQEFGLERLANESDRLALREELLEKAPKDSPKIVVMEAKKDMGVVSQQNGTVTTEFIVKNEGKSNLIIDKLSSSCGCTSASLIYQGQEGPRFYMAGHGHDEPDASWQTEVNPGDEAVVKVYYDPTVHPDLTGPVTRTVSIHSNDPVDFETKLTITLDQEK